MQYSWTEDEAKVKRNEAKQRLIGNPLKTSPHGTLGFLGCRSSVNVPKDEVGRIAAPERWMVVLGLDVGERRTGVAVSDPGGVLARPLTTVVTDSQEELIERLGELIVSTSAEAIVVGLPLRLNGDSGQEAERMRLLAARLQTRLELPVTLYDERLSTVEAERLLVEVGSRRRRRRRKEAVDRVAAALILQGFLDRQNREEATTGQEKTQ